MSAEYATISAARQAAVARIVAIGGWTEAKTPILQDDAKSLGHQLFAITAEDAPADPGAGIVGYDAVTVTFRLRFSYRLSRADRITDMDGATDAAVIAIQALLGEQCTHRQLENALSPEWLENWAVVDVLFTDLVRFST